MLEKFYFMFLKTIYIYEMRITRYEMLDIYIYIIYHTSGRQKFTLVSLLTKHSEVSGGSN